MIADNRMISSRQMAWILALDTVAAGLFWLPACLGGRAFPELVLTGIGVLVIFGLYEGLAFCWLDGQAGSVLRHRKADRQMLKSCELPWLLRLFFLVYYMAGLVYGVVYFQHMADTLIPADYRYPAPALFLLLAVIYGAGKGPEVRGRMAEMTGWLVGVPLVLLFAVGIWQAARDGQWSGLAAEGVQIGARMRWTTGAGLLSDLKDGYGTLMFFFLGVHPVLLWRQLHGLGRRKGRLCAGLVGGGLLVLAGLALTGVYLTPEGMASEAQPFGILLQLIRFPGNFISRYDVFFIMVWMLSFYMWTSGMLMEAAAMTGRRERPAACVCGLIVLVLSVAAMEWPSFEGVFRGWMQWAGMPVSVLAVALLPLTWRKWERVEVNRRK